MSEGVRTSSDSPHLDLLAVLALNATAARGRKERNLDNPIADQKDENQKE